MTAPASRPGDAKPASDRPAVLSWLPTIVMNVVLPTVTYFVLNGSAHIKPVPALLLSGVWPTVELGYTIWRQRHIDEFSVFVLIGLTIGVVTTVFSRDARAVFLKDWLVQGLFGLVLLASMLMRRPLMFYFGRRFATDGSKAQRDWWNGLWRHPQFRNSQRTINLVWGVALLGEAAVGAALTWTLGRSQMVVVNNVLPYVVFFALIFGTINYGRRTQAAATRRFGASAAPPGASPDPARGK